MSIDPRDLERKVITITDDSSDPKRNGYYGMSVSGSFFQDTSLSSFGDLAVNLYLTLRHARSERQLYDLEISNPRIGVRDNKRQFLEYMVTTHNTLAEIRLATTSPTIPSMVSAFG